MVSSKLKDIRPSPTVSLNNRYSELRERGENAISFAIGEPDMTTPREIIEFSMDRALKGGTHYTPSKGIKELRGKIAQKYAKLSSSTIKEDSVIITPAKFGLNMAVEAVVESGDNVLIQDPSFISYPEIIKIAGAVPRYFPSREDGSPDTEKIRELIDDRTRMIFINSPSNPHGWVASIENLKEIADIATDKKLYIVSDEIYEHIIYEGKHISILSLPGMEERTFIVNGFSKSHAMTGWRVGYLIPPSEFVPYVDAYQQHTITCAPSVSQFAALAAVDDSSFPEKMRSLFLERRDLLYSILSKSDKLEFKKPAGTFYAFPRLKNGNSGEEFSNQLLEKKKVLVTPGIGFGPSGHDRIRISFALSKNQLTEGANRIVDLLET